MTPSIQVEMLDKEKFQVRIIDGKSKTTHRVRLTEEDYRRLSEGKIPPEELIRRSFEFLLLREPKESILREFDLVLIGHYFPEYERELSRKI